MRDADCLTGVKVELRGSRIGLLAAFAFALGACSSPVDSPTDADTGSTHALVQVERNEIAGDASSAQATALAGFVQIPAAVDARSAMQLVGLGLDIPLVDQCAPHTADPSDSQTPIAAVEFLEAGDVTLDTAGSRVTLAPRALPTVTDLLSGVLYTTRDRAASALPTGTHYVVRTTGAAEVAQIVLNEDAPAALDSVTVGGVPLAQVHAIALGQPIDLTWTSGSASDVVVVQLSNTDGTAGVDCTFRDEAGAATVRAQGVGAAGTGSVTLRRIRRQQFDGFGLSQGTLRFDFGVTANVSFTE